MAEPLVQGSLVLLHAWQTRCRSYVWMMNSKTCWKIKEKAPLWVLSPVLLPEHHVNIPLLFNREYMSGMAQQLYLIRLMERVAM